MNDKASAPVDHLLTANNIDNNMAKEKQHIVDGPYAKYVLGLLVIMGIFNFIDRQIYLSPPYDCQKWTLPVG